MFHVPAHKSAAAAGAPSLSNLHPVMADALAPLVRRSTILDRVGADHRANQVFTTPASEAVALADAHLNNVGLPTYSEVLQTLNLCQRRLNEQSEELNQSGTEAGRQAVEILKANGIARL